MDPIADFYHFYYLKLTPLGFTKASLKVLCKFCEVGTKLKESFSSVLHMYQCDFMARMMNSSSFLMNFPDLLAQYWPI